MVALKISKFFAKTIEQPPRFFVIGNSVANGNQFIADSFEAMKICTHVVSATSNRSEPLLQCKASILGHSSKSMNKCMPDFGNNA